MDQNPYAPPRAVVSEPQPRISSDAPLFAISLTKLIVMNVVTLGIFELVWLYQHWATIRRRDRSDIWPVPRAIFGVLFGWSLFKRIQREGEQAGVQMDRRWARWRCCGSSRRCAGACPSPSTRSRCSRP